MWGEATRSRDKIENRQGGWDEDEKQRKFQEEGNKGVRVAGGVSSNRRKKNIG